ncbi:MAG TPA: glycosyltransferase [Candidatus Limnocylindria bacterium]|jgi:GT2 family glycosyltransferase|nr:glycosyltransferase [Candidatus Limnocylindria bacterium]
MSERPSVAIGVMAHNEERNIGRLLARLGAIEIADAREIRIIVVASGCTDGTVAIARSAAERDARITVVVEPERRGKAVAINEFITAAAGADILVMESADTLPEPNAIPVMVARFKDARVGMVGAHPVPQDDERTFSGYASQLLWRLHHAVASVSPKQGELVAWRNVVPGLPDYAVMDEAYLESAVGKQGLELAYAPDAIVHNHGPANVQAFLTQRRRNHAGHRLLAQHEGYRPKTRDHLLVARLALNELSQRPGRAHWFLAIVVLEIWSSVLGWWDHRIAHRSHAVWTIVEGTKALPLTRLEELPRIAVVSVSYENPLNILECLDSVKRNAYEGLRVIVVDNGIAGSAAVVREAYPDVEVMRLQNEGLASAVNTALHAALSGGAEYVILLNDDVVIARDFIAQAIGAAAVDPRAATVTGPVYYYDDPERLWYAGGEILWWLGKTFHRGRRVEWGPAFREPRHVAYGTGAATVFRADALRAVGDWDDRYFLVFEETDWCVRASRKGWHHLYTPGPKAWHKVSASFGGEKAALYLYFLFRNNIRFMRKYARPWHWPTFVLFFMLESLARYSVTSLISRDRWRRERAIWLAILDALRGRYGRGSWLPPDSAPAERRAEA